MSSIYEKVRIGGVRERVIVHCLVDTGAEISLLPVNLARHIGVWETKRQITVVCVHNQSRTLQLIDCRIWFPSLGNVDGQVRFAMTDNDQEPIIGMDVLKRIGISINTKTGVLSIQNEVWEVFKTFAGAGLALYAGINLLEALSGNKRRQHRHPTRR